MTNSTQIQVGTTIKSFDFPGVDDCFMIGVVTQISANGRLTCDTISQTFCGQPVEGFSPKFCTMNLGAAMLSPAEDAARLQVVAPAAKLV